MRPLAGLNVLEFAPYFPGQYLTQMLADLGADVTKIEPPGGEGGRRLPPLLPTGDGFTFVVANQGKASLALDLKTPAGRKAFDKLLKEADIFVQAVRPSTAQRLGADGERVLKVNKKLIVVEITGWGPKGGRASLPGHDLSYQAVAGLLLPIHGPRMPNAPIADLLGAFWGAVLALAHAVVPKTKRKGTILRVSLAGSALAASILQRALHAAGDYQPRQYLTGGHPGYGLYDCVDGKWLACSILEEQRWNDFLRLLGIPPAPASTPGLRERIAQKLRTADRETWLKRFAEADLAVGPVLSPIEAPAALAQTGAILPPHFGDPADAKKVPKLKSAGRAARS
jgi:alpha-methylacyl-CoA racemase